jgi:hypothetical protein
MAASLSTTSSSSAPAIGPTHPHYAIWACVWQRLAHVYEGDGPFLDGGAIIPHPREWEDHSLPIYATSSPGDPTEAHTAGAKIIGFVSNPNPEKPTAKLKERRKLARYENVAATIVDQKVAALFRQPPIRKVKGEDPNHPWLQWTENVDAKGTGLTDYMRDGSRVSMVFGHMVLMLDRPKMDTPPRTMADVAPMYLRSYTPLDMPDWLTDEAGMLTAVKLLEAVPRADLKTPTAIATWRVRYVTAADWEVVDEKQRGEKVARKAVDQGPHNFGVLPVVALYAKRRALIPVVGQSVLFDPNLFYDLYNLTSEKREILRKQTFSILNIPLGSGQDAMSVEDAKALLGQMVSTVNVMFSGLQAQYISPSGENVKAYHDEIATLIRTIFRLCSVPWESDSRDAESEGSMKLKREDMNQILSDYATELEKAEYALAERWFRGMYGQAWEKEWASAEPTIRYDRQFDVTPFQEMLTQAQAALALPLGQSKAFLLELCKMLLPLFLPNLPESVHAAIVKELEAQPSPQEQREARLAQMAGAFAGNAEQGAQEAAEAQAGEKVDDREAVAA